MNIIKCIIVDDHKIVIDGIKAMLFGINEIQIIGEASCGSEFLVLLNNIKADIAIIDVKLPDISGIDIVKQITRNYPSIKTIMLTSQDDEETILKAVQAGVMGFLPKNTNQIEFINAIKTIYDGAEYFGSNISKIIYSSFAKQLKEDGSNISNKPSFTAREKEIIVLISEGLSYKEISEKLFISVRTVETHKKNLQEKLSLKTNADIIKYAIRNGLIEL